MGSFYCSTVGEFLLTSKSELLGQLTLRYSEAGFAALSTDTPLTWWNDIEHLQGALATLCAQTKVAESWGMLLEFTVPRKLSRIDVVLLAGERVVLLECKTGHAGGEARRQLETYALLLHYFHEASQNRQIVPIVIGPTSRSHGEIAEQSLAFKQGELPFESLPSFWIRPVQFRSWQDLPELLSELEIGQQISSLDWNNAPYRPTPTIIEAARQLRSGLSIREIAMSEAAEHDIAEVTQQIHSIVDSARTRNEHTICFLTGVPGSGKTLVGLGLAHLSDKSSDAIHFMSGNGPLVRVLQEVFRREAKREGVSGPAAKVHSETLIENVHVFAKNYTENDRDRAPSNHVIVFDEAQRAWNRDQNLRKFGRDYSEPEMLLKIMERHRDWACVIALVGGGQEINSGEAGLEEWGRAISGSERSWKVYASPEVLTGGPSTAGRRLFEDKNEDVIVETTPLLHLRTSNRSLRAENLAQWVNCVLDGKAAEAADMRITRRFPISLTRDLNSLRRELRRHAIGESRFGLVASSKAARLRAEGLEPDSAFHAGYPWQHWYLSHREDVRSSYACEVFASEFEFQGLELDWIGLCWGGDFIWGRSGWVPRKWWQTGAPKWIATKSATDIQFRKNAYRVLLTRARQGMVIFVPKGELLDPTRDPKEFDRTAEYLVSCGVHDLDESAILPNEDFEGEPSLAIPD